MNRYSGYALQPPAIPIPFGKLLKVVAVVDPANAQTQELLAHIRADGYELEIVSHFQRDVIEDASVGAYIVLTDGTQFEGAKGLVRAVRELGFRTPIWALADSHRISDLPVVGGLGEVEGYIYLGQQSPVFYAKQVTASIVKYGLSLLPPFFGKLMAYDGKATIAFDCPGHQGGQFYRKSPPGQLFFKHFGEAIFRNDLCNADVELGDNIPNNNVGQLQVGDAIGMSGLLVKSTVMSLAGVLYVTIALGATTPAKRPSLSRRLRAKSLIASNCACPFWWIQRNSWVARNFFSPSCSQ